MNRRTIGGGLLAALVIAGIGFDLAERRRLQFWSGTERQLRGNYESLNREARDENRKRAAATGANGGAGAASARAPDAGAVGARWDTDPLQVIALNPALRAQYLKLYRDGLDLEWGLLIRLLKLSPEQTEKAKDLLTRFEDGRLQIEQTAAERGLPLGDPEMKQLRKDLSRSLEIDAALLLGPMGMITAHQYISSENVLPTIQALAGATLDDPMTVDQAGRLMSVLASASQRNSNGNVIEHTVNVEQAMEAAGSVLSPAQLAALGAILSKDPGKRRN